MNVGEVENVNRSTKKYTLTFGDVSFYIASSIQKKLKICTDNKTKEELIMLKDRLGSFKSSRASQLCSLAAAIAVAVSGMFFNAGPALSEHTEERVDLNIAQEVTIIEKNGKLVFTCNEIPDHQVGQFPEADIGRSTAISSQSGTVYEVTTDPKKNDDLTEIGLWPWGITLGGVTIDPKADEYYNDDSKSGWNVFAPADGNGIKLDFNYSHVQPTGQYHYHGLPTALVENESNAAHSAQIGYAADGFPIYGQYGYNKAMDANSKIVKLDPSYQLRSGTRDSKTGPGGDYDGTYVEDYEYVEGLGHLYQANGRYCKTPEYPNGTWAYFLTDGFPQVPRYLYGTPDDTFKNANQN